MNKAAIIRKSNLTYPQFITLSRDSDYQFFEKTNCFVLIDKFKQIKKLLDEKKTIEQINILLSESSNLN